MKEKKVDQDQERREHERTLDRFQHLEVEARRAKAEALSKKLSEVQSKIISNPAIKESVARDLAEKQSGMQRPDPNLMSFLQKTKGGNRGGVHNDEYEGIITGFEEGSRYSDDEDEF